jgi:four helix bundle protein
MAWKTNLKERAFAFALATLRLRPRLAKLGPEYAHIGMQLFRAGSAIPALLEEADVAASRRDMGAKQAIALREARESAFWLRLLVADQVFVDELELLHAEAEEFKAMLTVSVKKLRADEDQAGRMTWPREKRE